MNTTLPAAEAEEYAGLDAQSLGIATYMNNTLNSCEMSTMVVVFTSGEEPSSAQVQIQVGYNRFFLRFYHLESQW